MRLFKSVLAKLEVGVISTTGAFVSGLALTYQIRKCSDNSVVQSGVMTEIGTSGVYTVNFTPPDAIEYRVYYFAPSTYESGYENIYVDDQFAFDSTVAKDATVAKEATVLLIPTNPMLDTEDGSSFTAIPDMAKDSTVAKEATLVNRPTLSQIEASTVLAKQAELLRALGLVQENQYIDQVVYTGTHVTSMRLRIYNSAINVGTGTGVVATYTITANYVGDELDYYKVVKI